MNSLSFRRHNGVRAARLGGAIALFITSSSLGLGYYKSRSTPPPPVPKTAVDWHFARSLQADVFQKGNLHTHSLVSDGDAPPETVLRWYRTHGYHFVALTDHNTLVDPSLYRYLERAGFVLIAGEEVSMVGGTKQVHINALCTRQKIGGFRADTVREALERGVAQVSAQSGVSLLNHPNFDRAVDANDILATPGADLIEVLSGHPYVYTEGTDGRPSHEAIWDQTLRDGSDAATGLGPVGVDDAHHFSSGLNPEKNAMPGRAWTLVAASTTSEAAICAALRRGDTIATNGPGISRIRVERTRYEVWPSSPEDRVEFVGQLGELPVDGSFVDGFRHELRGDEGYVRARVLSPRGKRALLPAVRVVAVPSVDRPTLD